jgi:hypothetical protein
LNDIGSGTHEKWNDVGEAHENEKQNRTEQNRQTETQGDGVAPCKNETTSSRLGGLAKEGATEGGATTPEEGRE